MPAPPRSALLAGADIFLPAAVLAALPTLGLFAGPAYAALMIGLGLLRLVRAAVAPGARLAPPDRALAVFVVVFLLLCWASPLWSIVPATSLRGAAQASLILLPLLVLLCPWPLAEARAGRLLTSVAIAIPLGAVLASADLLSGLHVQAWIVHRPPIDALTKYNRGLDYLSLIVWPVAGALWRRGARGWALGLLAVVAVPVLIGHSLAGKVALAGGALVLGLAALLPRCVAWAMRIGAVGVIGALPVLFRALAVRRGEFVGLIKPSGINRLEIWDYMTARVTERPLLGWGLLSSDRVPITARELAGYRYVTAAGIYPHDQFLQAWLELGALGAACMLGLVLIALARLPRLPRVLRPFGLAAVAAALLIASVNYEITTDSWWAALAATTLLFRLAAAA